MVLRRHDQKSPCLDLEPPARAAQFRRAFKRVRTPSPSSGSCGAVRSTSTVRSTSAIRSTLIRRRAAAAAEACKGPVRWSHRRPVGRQGGWQGGQVPRYCAGVGWGEAEWRSSRRRILARSAPAAIRLFVWRSPTPRSRGISPTWAVLVRLMTYRAPLPLPRIGNLWWWWW